MCDRVNEGGCGDDLAAILEAAGFGVLFANADGRICGANRVARRLMRLCAKAETSSAPAAANGAFGAALRQLLARQCDAAPDPSETLLALERDEDSPPLFAHLVALRKGAVPADCDHPAIGILVVDVDRYTVPAFAAFAARHGLTRAEARVFEEIVSGQGLLEAARQLGVGATTARTHLSRIFSKTGTNRQTELIRLFLAGRRAPSGASFDRPGDRRQQ